MSIFMMLSAQLKPISRHMIVMPRAQVGSNLSVGAMRMNTNISLRGIVRMLRRILLAKAYAAFLEGQASGDLQRLFQNGWEDLGPLRVDSITGHYAAGLGRIEDFYVQPSNPNRLYLGSRSGGFWKSLDGGATWQGGATDFLVASGVNVMAVSPTNPDSILINVQNADNNYSHGIYRSINGGTSFNLSNFSPANVGFGGLGSNFRVYKIAYHPTIPNLVFVGTNKGLYRSTNNLATWTQVYSAGEFTQIAFHPSNPNIVYVLDTRGSSNLRDYVYRSTNAGATFSLSNQIPGNGPTVACFPFPPTVPIAFTLPLLQAYLFRATKASTSVSFPIQQPERAGLP
jgi:hypothetical protein